MSEPMTFPTMNAVIHNRLVAAWDHQDHYDIRVYPATSILDEPIGESTYDKADVPNIGDAMLKAESEASK